MANAILITPTGDVTEEQVNGLEDFQQHVGGYVEALSSDDGDHTIWLDPRQRQAQRRSSLAHELEHLVRGHRGCQAPAVERLVEEAAARTLIDADDLLQAFAWTSDPQELADELHVDVDMIQARLRSLTDDEAQRVRLVLKAREEVA